MPFRSAAQERYMWATHPKIAKEWSHKYGSFEHPRNKSSKKGAPFGNKNAKGGKNGR